MVIIILSLFTRFLQDAAKSNYYNRLPSPAFVTPIGREDAPIVVASLNNDVNTSVGEYRSSFSNIGPGVDIISAGSSVLGVSSTGYQDPRNSSFYIDYLSGTSMGCTTDIWCFSMLCPIATKSYKSRCQKLDI